MDGGIESLWFGVDRGDVGGPWGSTVTVVSPFRDVGPHIAPLSILWVHRRLLRLRDRMIHRMDGKAQASEYR